MKKYGLVLIATLFLGVFGVSAQISPDCSTAIPICNNTPVNGGAYNFGLDDFNGASETGCLEQTISGTIESNSGWYRFKTSASGQLGFNIGFDASEDWDFALYKTNDCNNLGEPLRCNFYDNAENSSFIGVGEDPTGVADSIQFEDWINVSPGEDYYLLINNFSNNNSGFSIQFSGSVFETNPYDTLDCSIINNLLGPPIAACENDAIVLDATTASATQYNWYQETGLGFQPMAGENNPTLNVGAAGLYRVEVVTPTGNIYSDVQVAFSVAPIAFLVTDDDFCMVSNSTFDLSQKDNEALGSQSTSEFMVTYHSTLTDAMGGFNMLSEKYVASVGVQTIYVRVASLANPMCYDASRQFELTAVETPILDFPTEVFLCDDLLSTAIGDAMPNAGHSYFWNTGEVSPTINVTQAGTYDLTITNTQGGKACADTFSITVYISNAPVITDVLIEDKQKYNTVTIITEVEGDFEYSMDDGISQTNNIFADVLPGEHLVTIIDLNGCGSVSEYIMVVGFPRYFSPNGDGINDQWGIVGMSELENPIVYVFDKFGKLLGQMNEGDNGWDGTYNGRQLPATDYWFKLTYIDSSGQRVEAKYVENHFSLRR
ncbi:MAG: hypothetical protein COA50_11970 [Flavobacteriaceae bacterium]|nr:MAG: hypothetical protein COA50_11970 [Flavobacteriaceae bacterium]